MSLPVKIDLWEFTTRYPIIVSDDDLGARNLMMLMLARQNLFAIANSQPEDTLYLCRHFPVSLVMSDLMKPGMSGFEMIEILRKDEQTRHIPIVVCSARSDKTSMERALALGADGFFSKPVGISLEKLFDTMRRLLTGIHARLTTTQFAHVWESDTTPSGFYPVHTTHRVRIPAHQWVGTVHCL